KLIALLALPAIILKALITATITPDLIYLPISALLVAIAMTLIGLLWVRALGWPRPTAGALVTAFPSCEGGSVGYPLMLLAFGELGLSRIVLYDLVQAVFLLTVLYCLSAWYGQAGVSGRAIALQLARTPFFWAIVLGLMFNLTGMRNPVLLDLLDIVGSGFLLLMLLLLSLEFQVSQSALGMHLGLAALKTTCGLALGWGAVQLFGLEGVNRAAVIVGATLPPSMLTILFARENHLDTQFAVGLVSVGIPFALVVLTGLLNYL
ncbi:hypothetical protein C7271_13290, partial [filamentous cyanobacterium CCP5]